MCSILIFGGTTEGRLLAEFCAEQDIPVYVSVATAYGASLLKASEAVRILIGRKNAADIQQLLLEKKIRLVMDATHPYAEEATQNIRTACRNAAVPYRRVLRETTVPDSGNGIYFSDLASIVQYLNQTSGNILLTTGSKTIAQFCAIKQFDTRCIVRILPIPENLEQCLQLGFPRKQILAEKGPFSIQQNLTQMQQYHIRYVVTKESGATGGFPEKLAAANACGARLLILQRPQESGIAIETAKKMIASENAYEP